MTTRATKRVVRYLRRMALRQDGAGLTDGQLLSCFIERRDEAAFAALVRRHGPMVWGVCRRLLASHHDAEDAFQATFLVLVRKASSVVPREMVANWLHGVAQKTAWKARTMAARRKAREKQVSNMPEPAATDRDMWRELQPVLDRELSRLPDKYRVALILCDLEGKTRREAARQLGVPDGTLAARLSRGRAMLARRLAREGWAVSEGLLTALVVQQTASACAPAVIVSSTIKAATSLAAGSALTAGLVPATVAALTQGVLKSMFIARLKMTVAVLLAASALAFSVGTSRTPTAAASHGADDKETPRTAPAPRLVSAVVQVRIAGPAGMKVTLLPASGRVGRAPQIEAPGRLDLPRGRCLRLRLADIPGRPGLERFPTVEIPPANTAAEPFVTVSPIPIEFTDDDFDHVDRGAMIAKVIYLPTPGEEQQEIRNGKAITILSYEHPEWDVIQEAKRRGAILAVVRMGDINLEASEADKEGKLSLERAGKLVEITIGNDGRLGRLERTRPGKVKTDDRDTLLCQLDRLMVELHKAHTENEALKKRLKDASAKAGKDVLLDQIEHWMMRAAKTELKNESLKKELDDARMEMRSLQAALAERERELRNLKKAKK